MTQTPVPAAQLPGGGSMPLLGFGTWQITGPQAYDAVRTALDVGYRHLDTATVYRNEEEVGRALAESRRPARRGLRDHQGAAEARRRPADDPRDLAAEAGHRPRRPLADPLDRGRLDPRGPLAGAARRAEGGQGPRRRRQQLLARPDRPAHRGHRASSPPSTRSSGRRRSTTRSVARGHAKRGIVLEGYSALKNTDLDDAVLRGIADAHGVSAAQVLLRWHLDHGFVAIPKSVTPERIEANFAITGFSLTPDEVARIDGLAGREPAGKDAGA